MYADRESDAMRTAIAETQKRRTAQLAYNAEHGITPVTIKKNVQDILERHKVEDRDSAETSIEVIMNSYNILIPKERDALVRVLEREMLEHAKNLEFEKAAVIRDEIEKIKSAIG
jgi:excinuclease ABC subunit B